MRHFATCVAVIGALVAFPGRAWAEPIQVTGGGFSLDFEGHILNLIGTGFAIRHAPDPTNLGLFIPRLPTTGDCGACDPGDELNVSFKTPGDEYLGIGDATIGGTNFSNVTLRGTLDFQADPFTMPVGVPDNEFFRAVSAFAFTGAIRGLSGGTELFSVALAGSGHVSTEFFTFNGRFVPEAGGEPLFLFENVAPTPEPSTLVLVGLGLAAAARARRAAGTSRRG